MNVEDLKFGYIKSKPDHRDYIYGQIVGLDKDKVDTLPSEFFHPRIPKNLIINQVIGDCVGQSSRYIKILQEYRSTGQWYDLNADFVYSICKTMDGIPDQEGTYPIVAQKVLNSAGICHRDKYTDLTSNNNRPTPSQDAYNDAKNFVTKSYARVQTLEEIKHAIVEQGAVQIAVIVCENFVNCESGGFIDLPQGRILGGHAICVDGFSDTMIHTYKNGTTRKGFLRILNSWGSEWGDEGYGYIPYDFLTYRNIDLGTSFFEEAWSAVDQTNEEPNPVPEPTPQPQPESKDEQIIIEMWIGNDIAKVNGVDVKLDQPPVILNNRTVVPARFIGESLKAAVYYYAEENKVTIIKRVK